MLCKTHPTFPEEFEPEQLFLCAKAAVNKNVLRLYLKEPIVETLRMYAGKSFHIDTAECLKPRLAKTVG